MKTSCCQSLVRHPFLLFSWENVRNLEIALVEGWPKATCGSRQASSWQGEVNMVQGVSSPCVLHRFEVDGSGSCTGDASRACLLLGTKWAILEFLLERGKVGGTRGGEGACLTAPHFMCHLHHTSALSSQLSGTRNKDAFHAHKGRLIISSRLLVVFCWIAAELDTMTSVPKIGSSTQRVSSSATRAARKHVRKQKRKTGTLRFKSTDKELEHRVLESFRGVLEAAGSCWHRDALTWSRRTIEPRCRWYPRYRVRKQNRC